MRQHLSPEKTVMSKSNFVAEFNYAFSVRVAIADCYMFAPSATQISPARFVCLRDIRDIWALPRNAPNKTLKRNERFPQKRYFFARKQITQACLSPKVRPLAEVDQISLRSAKSSSLGLMRQTLQNQPCKSVRISNPSFGFMDVIKKAVSLISDNPHNLKLQ
jgi:hypothetical protein